MTVPSEIRITEYGIKVALAVVFISVLASALVTDVLNDWVADIVSVIAGIIATHLCKIALRSEYPDVTSNIGSLVASMIACFLVMVVLKDLISYPAITIPSTIITAIATYIGWGKIIRCLTNTGSEY